MEQEDKVQYCQNCTRFIFAANFAIHRAFCERNIYVCQICKEPVNLFEKNEHDECHIASPCKLCKAPVEKWMLPKHTELCSKKQACKYCEADILLRELSGHEEFCGTRREICLLCRKYFMFKELSKHYECHMMTIGKDGTLREISRGVEWKVCLPPSNMTWNLLSSLFTCGGLEYHLSLYSNKHNSGCIYFGVIIDFSNFTNDFPLPIQWCIGVKRKDIAVLRWIMSGQITEQRQCHQHTKEVCINRAELDSSLSSISCLTVVHYMSMGKVDKDKEVPKQADITEVSCKIQTKGQKSGTVNLKEFEDQFRLCLDHPEEGDCVCLTQKKPLETSIRKFLSELPRGDKKHFICAA